jgi:hypothetical protein
MIAPSAIVDPWLTFRTSFRSTPAGRLLHFFLGRQASAATIMPGSVSANGIDAQDPLTDKRP